MLSIVPEEEWLTRATEVEVKCDCEVDETVRVKYKDLKSKRKKACGLPGCTFTRRHSRGAGKSKHGTRISDELTKVNKRWQNMHLRCYDKEHKSYPQYGGIGLTVGQEWHESNIDGRSNYVKWIKQELGSDDLKKLGDLTVDRIDGTKGYYPDNCRLASKSIQSANRGIFKTDPNLFKHIREHKRVGSESTYEVIIGYEKEIYRVYGIPNMNEAKVILYYIANKNNLLHNILQELDFTMKIGTLTESTLLAETRCVMYKITETDRSGKVYHHRLEPINKHKLGQRIVKMIFKDGTIINTKTEFPFMDLERYIK